MNADDAYEQHTDLVRALAAPDSVERTGLEHFARATGQQPPLPGMRLLMEQHHMLARQAQGADEARVAMVVGWEPTPTVEDADPDTVGVEDPDRPADVPDADVPDAAAFPVETYLDATVHELARAATFYVTRDMCALLEHAARSLDETDVMPRHPAHPAGFVVLAEPIRLPYGDGTEQVVHAFGWAHYAEVLTVFGGAGQAGTVFQFADRVRAPGERGVLAARAQYPSKTAWTRSPRLVFTMADDFVVGAPVGPATQQVRSATLGERRREAMRNQAESDREPAVEVGRFQPYLAAFLLLLTQQVTTAQVHLAPADRVRRASRAGRSVERVTVVDLRRRDGGPLVPGQPGASGRHYSVRHLVGGHWKWQPYGPERRLRRRIFVEGYVRGPDDKPLVVKPRVHRL